MFYVFFESCFLPVTAETKIRQYLHGPKEARKLPGACQSVSIEF